MRILILSLLIFSTLPSLAEESKDTAKTAIDVVPMTRADKRAEELDRLFGKLKVQRAKVESRIWELWVQSDSSTADLILSQATKALSDEKYDVALPMFDQLAKHYPDYAEIYNKRATIYFVKGNYDKALSDIEKVLDIEPRHFGALSGRGAIYLEKKDDQKALRAFREALAINPEMEGIQAAVKMLEKRSPDI